MNPSPPAAEDPVTVLLVDDIDDIRAVVRLALELDGRYEVIGEAADGIEGVAAAERLRPDIVILDRSMPRMDGLAALERIRAVAPDAAVVLYTAENDAAVHQAAIAGGALDVMAKDVAIAEVGSLLADALVRSASSGGNQLDVYVGPVPSAAALEWIDNTRKILRAVRDAPDVTDTTIEPEVFDTFLHYLDIWERVAEASPEFVWAARAPTAEVERLIGAWASIDRIDDDRLRALGCEWSSASARSFFDALTAAVLRALATHEHTVALARRLEPQWAPPATSS